MLLTRVDISVETTITELVQMSIVPPISSWLLRLDSVETQPPPLRLETQNPFWHRLHPVEVLQVISTHGDPQICWPGLLQLFPLQVLHPSNLSDVRQGKYWILITRVSRTKYKTKNSPVASLQCQGLSVQNCPHRLIPPV